ncbi:hypothetical protein D3C74_109760 [compost metagenome]
MAWASTKESAKPKREPIPLGIPRDQDLCFVLFPSGNPTASSVAVSLQSLLHQVQKHPASQQIEVINYDPQARRFDIRFAPNSQKK